MAYRFADSLRAGAFACSQIISKPVWHIPLLCVQWKTPDDGQRNCPKHVEFHSKNKFEKWLHIVGFIIRNWVVYCLLNMCDRFCAGARVCGVSDSVTVWHGGDTAATPRHNTWWGRWRRTKFNANTRCIPGQCSTSTRSSAYVVRCHVGTYCQYWTQLHYIITNCPHFPHAYWTRLWFLPSQEVCKWISVFWLNYVCKKLPCLKINSYANSAAVPIVQYFW